METPKLKVELRDLDSRVKPNALRRDGFIPGVLYGRNKDTKELKLRTKELQKIVETYGYGAMVNIEINNKITPAIIKEIQKATVTHNILHIDLQELSDDIKIKLNIPIILENKESVESSSSVVEQQLKDLNIQCLPKYIPTSITVNADVLEKSSALKVKDLEVINDENIEVLNDPEELIASLTHSTKEVVEETDDKPIYETSKSILES